MRSKRVPSHEGSTARPSGKAGGHAGLIVDWLGVQATGQGGVTAAAAGLIVVLVAVRAAPYLMARAARRLARLG